MIKLNPSAKQYLLPKTTITVEEMNSLVKEIEAFYKARGNPTINIFWLANMMLRRLRNDKDFYANIEGETGMGKSNLILLISLLMCRYAGTWKNKSNGKIVQVYPRTTPLNKNDWEQLTVNFDFNNNMSFLDKTEELKNKYNNLDRYMPFIIDEGSKNLHKYGWQNKLQQMLVQMSQTERYQNKAFFVCFPNFKELTTTFRNDRIKMRLYIYQRSMNRKFASCIISVKDVNRWNSDPWHMDENAKNFEYVLRRVPAASRGPQQILNAEKKLKGYAGNFEFPSIKDIAPRIWKIYMKFKILNATKEQGGEEETKDSRQIMRWKYATKQLMYWVIQQHPEFKMGDFAKLTSVSSSTLSKLKRENLLIEDEKLKQLRTETLLTPKN